ncbi:hypothetical protein [Sinorhizobium arboris]
MPADTHHLAPVLTAYVITAGSPGPGNMLIMGIAMNEGRKAAVKLLLTRI